VWEGAQVEDKGINVVVLRDVSEDGAVVLLEMQRPRGARPTNQNQIQLIAADFLLFLCAPCVVRVVWYTRRMA
jgi:hypothetical protein